jgi:hypothetical protein
MATILSAFKMVNAVRQVKVDSTQFRRQKMAKKIDEQVKLAIALRDGQTCVIKRLRNVTDKSTGLVSQMEVSKRINQWWWTESNRILLQLKYGTRVLLLNGKDKNTIEIGSGDELIKVLELVKTSVNNGELDSAIEAASVKVRERFKK